MENETTRVNENVTRKNGASRVVWKREESEGEKKRFGLVNLLILNYFL